MRVWLAGLFVFGGLTLAAALLFVLLGERAERISPFIIGPVLAGFCFLLCLAALVLFNIDFRKPQPSEDYAQKMQAWEELGLITTTDYHATRVFEVAEFEDESPHFFLELQDGSVLYLNGAYLYDVTDSEEGQEQEAPFPCTEFTLKRHPDGGVIDLVPRGQPLHCELLDHYTFWEAAYSSKDFPLPNDGEIITDRTYDQLRMQDSIADLYAPEA